MRRSSISYTVDSQPAQLHPLKSQFDVRICLNDAARANISVNIENDLGLKVCMILNSCVIFYFINTYGVLLALHYAFSHPLHLVRPCRSMLLT